MLLSIVSKLFNLFYIETKELDNVDFLNKITTKSFKYEDDLTHKNILIKLNPYGFILSNLRQAPQLLI